MKEGNYTRFSSSGGIGTISSKLTIESPILKQKGILFAGIDIIGDYLTEINITSPTCIRELDQIYSLDIAGDLMRCIEQKITL